MSVNCVVQKNIGSSHPHSTRRGRDPRKHLRDRHKKQKSAHTDQWTRGRDDETREEKKTHGTLRETTILLPHFVSCLCLLNRCWYRGEYKCAVPAPKTSLCCEICWPLCCSCCQPIMVRASYGLQPTGDYVCMSYFHLN